MKRRTDRMPLRGLHPGEFPGYAVPHNLLAANAGSGEWILYAYLVGLAHHEQCNPVSTTVTRLRHGTVADDAYPKVPLSLNTIKTAMARLEESGLISVASDRQGPSLMLSITLE